MSTDAHTIKTKKGNEGGLNVADTYDNGGSAVRRAIPVDIARGGWGEKKTLNALIAANRRRIALCC